MHRWDITLRWVSTFRITRTLTRLRDLQLTPGTKESFTVFYFTVSLHIMMKVRLKRMQNCVNVLVAKLCFSRVPVSCGERRHVRDTDTTEESEGSLKVSSVLLEC